MAKLKEGQRNLIILSFSHNFCYDDPVGKRKKTSCKKEYKMKRVGSALPI